MLMTELSTAGRAQPALPMQVVPVAELPDVGYEAKLDGYGCLRRRIELNECAHADESRSKSGHFLSANIKLEQR